MRITERLRIVLILALLVSGPSSTAPAQTAEGIPWDLNKLHQPPTYEWLERSGAVHGLFYGGEAYQGQPTRVFAYYASPGTLAGDRSLDKNLPAVVLVHGGGGTAFREWAELWAQRGYAAIAMDLAGHRPQEGENAHDARTRTRLDDGGPNQGDDEKFGSIDQPASEQWPYHAVANVIRAHSLIRTFDGVDAERTAVTGISWGGYLTCIVAGVDDRFQAAVPVYGCGYLEENSAWLQRFADMSPAQRQRWVGLWDPSRYLPAVSMPILFVNGTNDFAYPLDSYMKSYDAVPGEKKLCITVNMPHGHPPGWAPGEIAAFVDQHLRDGPPLLDLEALSAGDEDQKVSFLVEGTQAVQLAELHYTTGTGKFSERRWTTAPATVQAGQLRADAPPAGTTAWFVTVKDARGLVVSSRIFFPTPSTAADQAD